MESIASPFDFVIFYKKKIVSQNSRAFAFSSCFFYVIGWSVICKCLTYMCPHANYACKNTKLTMKHNVK